MHIFLAYLIIILGSINLIRMTIMLIGADVYEIKQKRIQVNRSNAKLPTFSIVVPAYNEERSIHRSLESLDKQMYPKRLFQVIVVDDGSKDKTAKIVKSFIAKHTSTNILLIQQKNHGKAVALNNGMANHATGELIMCLDSDSAIAPDALEKAAKYFSHPDVMALSANVKIIPGTSLLNLIQQLEYLVCYQMKRAQTTFNIEYIIGGIGSTFRKSILEQVNYYDGDTITEDIDLTMKIIQLGNKKHRVVYGADVIAYTESVHSLTELIKQRFRWKWGRCQTFLKNKNLFFNSDRKYTKPLTYLYLPYAIFGDIAFFLEPFMLAYILYIVVSYNDLFTFISAVIVITIYLSFNILSETTITKKQKLQYLFVTPAMYFLFYVISYAEYMALIKSLIKLPNLQKSIAANVCNWEHVERLHTT